jgi:hypothetical protein
MLGKLPGREALTSLPTLPTLQGLFDLFPIEGTHALFPYCSGSREGSWEYDAEDVVPRSPLHTGTLAGTD